MNIYVAYFRKSAEVQIILKIYEIIIAYSSKQIYMQTKKYKLEHCLDATLLISLGQALPEKLIGGVFNQG